METREQVLKTCNKTQIAYIFGPLCGVILRFIEIKHRVKVIRIKNP